MSRLKPSALTPEALADLCLGHLAEDPAQLADFLQATGFDPQGLRAALGTDTLRHALIDYVAANESLLLAVCANAGISPDAFMRVWHQLNPAMN